MFLHADSEDSDQTGRMPRLIWVFADAQVILSVLLCGGSFENVNNMDLEKSKLFVSLKGTDPFNVLYNVILLDFFCVNEPKIRIRRYLSYTPGKGCLWHKLTTRLIWAYTSARSHQHLHCSHTLYETRGSLRQRAINEPSQDKTDKMVCATSEDSDQPGHLPSLISLHCRHEESLVP